jgi:Fic family protein
MGIYIYENTDWPKFVWDNSLIIVKLSEVRNLQGKLMGRMENLELEARNMALLENLTLDVIKSTEIEGEILNVDQVRSSFARRLGIEIAKSIDSERNVDGMVDMILDATQNCFENLSEERLFNWHGALFPTGRSGMYKIRVGEYRDDNSGPMQVISGALGKEKIHFQAPNAILLKKEMNKFLDWFNLEMETDYVLKAAIAHLWFVTLHPFDDGNGRITRAITEMLLARSDKSKQRFYSMSAQIRIERKEYYSILEKTQKGNLDISKWLIWFLDCLINTINSTDEILTNVFKKAVFWQKNATIEINKRQIVMVNKLFDGFEGKLNSSKWAKINKCSSDTALRDIQDLISKGILNKDSAGGRSANYELIIP